ARLLADEPGQDVEEPRQRRAAGRRPGALRHGRLPLLRPARQVVRRRRRLQRGGTDRPAERRPRERPRQPRESGARHAAALFQRRAPAARARARRSGAATSLRRRARVGAILHELCEALRVTAQLVEPFLPETARKLATYLGFPEARLVELELPWGAAFPA